MNWRTVLAIVVVYAFGVVVGMAPWNDKKDETTPPSHFILCPEMKSAVGVYGYVQPEGSYLKVYLTKDETSLLTIGPDCLIIPNVKEE